MPSCAIPWQIPMSSGRLWIGTAAAMIVKAPFCRPAVPIPAIALPTISILEEVATPQSRDPTSKRQKKVTKVHLFLNTT